MSAVYVFEELRLPAELYAAALVFLLPFARKRGRFRTRAAAGFLAGLLFSLLFFVIFGEKETPRWHELTAFWYAIVGLTVILYARFCFFINRIDAIFLGIAGFAAQNIVYSLYHLYFARMLVPALRHHLLLYAAGAVLVTALLCCLLHRIFAIPLQECRGFLFEEDRPAQVFYLFLFLFMIVILFFYQAAFDHSGSFYDRMGWLSGILICAFMLLVQYSMIRGIR